jgi:hypothetical protein
MKSRASAVKHKQTAGGATVGRDRFGKISAVEGIAFVARGRETCRRI